MKENCQSPQVGAWLSKRRYSSAKDLSLVDKMSKKKAIQEKQKSLVNVC